MNTGDGCFASGKLGSGRIDRVILENIDMRQMHVERRFGEVFNVRSHARSDKMHWMDWAGKYIEGIGNSR